MNSQKGFTLIEIMVVLAIIAAVVSVGIPRLFGTSTNIKSVARQIVVMGKEIRNKARLTNSTYRLVINMEPDKATYWVERANGPQSVDPEAAEKSNNSRKEEDAPPPLFQMDPSFSKKQKELPSGLRFGSVETANMKSPINSGLAYIHFFPEGFVEAAALQITNGNKLTWTLVFNPLTGQADIIEKAQSLKDIQR